VRAFAATVDVATGMTPDWIIEGASVNDEAGHGALAAGTMVVQPVTYGPICVTGTWPDLAFTPGEGFEVTPAP
jgi:hypothetical protein